MINKLKVKELKAMAEKANVKGWKSMKKEQLIEALQVTRKYGPIFDYMEDYGVSFEEAKDMASDY